MASDNKSNPSNSSKNTKKRKHYLPYNRPVKKGAYPLRPGVEGFFVTCDGGREHQASNEAINVIDSFYEELLEGTESKIEQERLSKKPVNKITKFTYSDSSSSDEECGDEDANDYDPKPKDAVEEKEDHAFATGSDAAYNSGLQTKDGISLENKKQDDVEKPENHRNKEAAGLQPSVKKQCVESDPPNCGHLSKKAEKQSVDRLIEAELAELGDRSKRRFSKLDSGCNGVIFIQMRKSAGDPCPKDIVQHMMTSLASTRKHVSRFMLRVLPVEVACYTSEEEIRQAIKPIIDKHFPVETKDPHKYAVLYDARANTGIDRTKIIDTVAKCVPSPHKVDLGNPDINIVVQIVKTVCLIGVVEKYKELAKYNLRQLTSPRQ